MLFEPTKPDRKGTSPPAVWATMANEFREYDQDNVKRGKGDVDTLLVFAGLFSAVLASFLVAVYPSLQPSPMDVMNYTLQRIANQTASYDFTDGRMIATNPSSPPPPFQASAEDIRVNVLWFASLIISLMTSSFGMLVKQWMDDFLAVDIPESQARLRLRHHRAPQIEAWLVYEIVACLPILLHLSLGLFFVGLCYFTSAIHASVGYTTLPLVIGWTFCLFFTTALPIFFPRCPYKISLFKPIVTRLHRALSYLVDPRKPPPTESPDGAQHSYISSLYGPAALAVAFIRRALRRLRLQVPWARPSLNRWDPYWPDVYTHIILALHAHLMKVYTKCTIVLHGYMVHVHTTITQALRNIPDEDKVAKDSAADLKIFAEVDAMRANDEILSAIVAEELPLIKPDWKSATMFAIEALAHRARTVAESERLIPEWPFRDPFPFDLVRSQAKESILATIFQCIGTGFWYTSGWHRDSVLDAQQSKVALSLDSDRRAVLCTLTMVLSNIADSSGSEVHLPPSVVDFLRWHLCEDYGAFICRNILYLMGWHCEGRKSFWNSAARLLTSLAKLSTPLNLTWKAKISCFKSIQCLKVADSRDQVNPAAGVCLTWDYPAGGFGAWKDWQLPDDTSDTLKGAVLEYLFVCVLAEFKRVEGTAKPSREGLKKEAPEVLDCSLHLFLKQQERVTVPTIQAFVDLVSMKSKELMDVVIESLVSTDLSDAQIPQLDLYSRWSNHTLWTIRNKHIKLTNTALDGNFATLSSLVTEKLADPDTNLVRSLSLCHIAILLFLAIHAQPEKPELGIELFSFVATFLIEKAQEDIKVPDNQMVSQLAHNCLDIMQYEHVYGGWYDEWHAAFLQARGRSSFPDNLVKVLGQFIPENKVYYLHRLQEFRHRTHSSTPLVDTLNPQKIKVQLIEQDEIRTADESGSLAPELSAVVQDL